jgi:14-3-3 protein epsilon
MSRIDNLETLEREELLYLARLAEQSERYDEMVRFVDAFVKRERNELTVEERNILSVAYKNVVGTRRTSWRVLHSIQQKEERRGNEDNKNRAHTYKSEVEVELRKLCNDILQLIDNHLLPAVSSSEGRVFYHKMKGDYFRYISEFASGDLKESSSNKALESYQAALDVAKNELPPTHPTRLGLALNFSVFYYEILQKTEEACQMARTAFDEAIPELDNISEENYKDSTLILQLLRDNLTLWNSENPDA